MANGKFRNIKKIVSKAAKINGKIDHPVVQDFLDACDKALTTELVSPVEEVHLMTKGKHEGQMNSRDAGPKKVLEISDQGRRETIHTQGPTDRDGEKLYIPAPVRVEQSNTADLSKTESLDNQGTYYRGEPDTLGSNKTETPGTQGAGNAEIPNQADNLNTEDARCAEGPDNLGQSQVESPDTQDARCVEEPVEQKLSQGEPVSTVSPLDLIRHPKLRLFTSVMIFAW